MLQSSIRSAIPLTDQTNPDKFPAYEYRPFPRMMLKSSKEPFRDSVGNAIVVHDQEEEDAFLLEHPDAVRPVEFKRTAADLRSENETVRGENARLRKQIEEMLSGGATVNAAPEAAKDDAVDEAPAEVKEDPAPGGSAALLAKKKLPGKLK